MSCNNNNRAECLLFSGHLLSLICHITRNHVDSMKALQPLLAKNARRSSSICCRWLNNECSTLLLHFLLLALLFRKIANMRIFHSERSNQENTYTLLYFAGILTPKFYGPLQKELFKGK